MAETPPAAFRDPATAARLESAYAARGPGWRPRTRHLDAAGRPRYVNRLIEEGSPYLLQHAHNPVDWRPWGPEALAEAAARDVPLFISVGYATCHWCHVMEEESFDDEEVAAALNARFVPIKIDREQRPDLDQVYIMATQLQHRQAGWPNSIWATPDGRPFHTGTYFPKPQFLRMLEGVARAWEGEGRAEIMAVAEKLSEAVNRHSALRGEGRLDAAVFTRAAGQLAEAHNPREGGFSEATQFPQEGFLLFLTDHWRRTGERAALDAARRTLDAIAAGGIHDHVGGGFHRYAVDANWRTPHFEKMLYNQALLARAFTEMWEIAGDPAHRRAAERAFAYVLRDLTAPSGAFFAAEDADSFDASGELEEGAFYVWPPEDAMAALGPVDGVWAVATLGLDRPPTLEAGPVAHLRPGAAIDFARLDPILERLRAARDARARPLRDEKIIGGWNGLMIRALAEGGAAFDAPELVAAAGRAADAVWAALWSEDGLARLSAGGRALERGDLSDHAWLGLGALALHDATGEARWLERAEALAEEIARRFDDGAGRLKMAAEDGPIGPVYANEDGATPSGESSALELFARLDRRTAGPEPRARAERLLAAISGPVAEAPTIRTEALIAARVLADGESSARRALAKGAAQVRLDRSGARPILHLRITPGWHAGAPEPGAAGLAGLAVAGAAADWPAPARRTLGAVGAEAAVYEGAVAIPLTPEADEIAVTLQLCSDAVCLAPEEVRFRLR